MYVKSATHVRFGSVAVKSRLTRSGDAIESLPAIVVLHGFPRRLAPQMALADIRRSTWPRPTVSPWRRSAFHIRRDP
jgi:hypothetical protein